ncbi:unnamed protein product [Rangifer tarandus platyrhynchus]|uniref:Secreted protein n=1 Tax=Rangifer tarandus platyrhynchus TaxID=3082113 RepID=A0ABN8XJ60_RANTA|nr:unnamed protein product [Rangifer tarandus platyrhynchus]
MIRDRAVHACTAATFLCSLVCTTRCSVTRCMPVPANALDERPCGVRLNAAGTEHPDHIYGFSCFKAKGISVDPTASTRPAPDAVDDPGDVEDFASRSRGSLEEEEYDSVLTGFAQGAADALLSYSSHALQLLEYIRLLRHCEFRCRREPATTPRASWGKLSLVVFASEHAPRIQRILHFDPPPLRVKRLIRVALRAQKTPHRSATESAQRYRGDVAASVPGKVTDVRTTKITLRRRERVCSGVCAWTAFACPVCRKRTSRHHFRDKLYACTT